MKILLSAIIIFTSIIIASNPTYSYTCPGDPRCVDDDPIGQPGGLGTITPPDTVPTVAGDPTTFVAGLFRNAVSLLLIVAFAVFLIWTMIAGFRFIFAGGDEKTIGSAWSQIYWGLIGMAIILSSFAIIKLVETFFGVSIFTNFQLPQGP